MVESPESSKPNQQLPGSFLSKLCFDIRRSIYEQLILDLGPILHIAVTDVRPGRQNPKHFKQVLQPCIAGPKGHVGLEHWGGWESAHTKCIESFSWGVGGSSDQTGIVRAVYQSWRKSAPKPWNLISLLLSCKYINAEFIDVIYTFATFDLIGLQCATRFLTEVPQEQLNQIRSLRISHKIEHPIYTCFHYEPKDSPAFKRQQEKDQELARWQAKHLVYIGDVLSRTKGLKDLHVTFYDVTGRRLEMSLLYPLAWIENVENFQVDLPWALERAVNPYNKNATLPFNIRRPSLEEEPAIEAVFDMRKFELWMFKLGRFLRHPYLSLR
ncbi:uncharacterized protein EAE98_008047 [Botrytis deweyae]|uniref:DUF7730 domain-containing protein n=1 Tax=Botrytis deweyae TaxID=2478750 RepID=A0ABQ7IFU6_9HELO|nr:uncharacterized protein EAE98_008047 [Botrytis deweyae]KAF7922521.1 hypothetical protein EAE98_008047 [Botrytis deweyae]